MYTQTSLCSLLLQLTNSKRLNTHRIFKRIAKALIILCICAGWSEALLVPHTTLLEISSRLNYILSRHRTQSRTFAYMVNSSYACLPLIWFGICKLWKQVGETSVCIRISCNLEKYHVSVLKMILGDASRAHRLLHDKVRYSLHAFYRMPKCFNWRNILSWIPLGSDLDPNSDNVLSSFLRERGSKYH